MNRNTIVGLLVALVVVVALLVLLPFGKGNAVTGNEPCVPSPETTETVVVTPAVPATPGTPAIPAVTETVHHDAVTHVVHHEAVPAGPDLWWNWSPNRQNRPFVGPPAFPVDARGTWQGPHENGGPSQDTYGTFQQGHGHGSWFHREHGTPGVDAYDETVVDVPAYDETVVVTPEVPAVPGTPEVPAVTQTIVHPAVTCDTPSETPTVTPTPETPVVTPVVPTETPTVTPEPEPETPVSSPPKPPKNVQLTECVDGVFVTTVNGEVISKAGSCEVREGNSEPVAVEETGL